MNWNRTTLGAISLGIQPGPFGSQLHSSDYSSSGTPIIMPKDMIDGRVDTTNLSYISDDHVNRLSRHQAHAGDIVHARKGDVTKCVYIDEAQDGWLTGSDCLKVAIDHSKCVGKFVYYALQAPMAKKWLEMHAIGATMPSVNSGILADIPLILPERVVQDRIVKILSRYDALIENYRAQIRLLEEAAQRLYKEWFVKFHYPGWEKERPASGEVPRGWETKPVSDFFAITIGKTPPRAEPQWFVGPGKGVAWVSVSDMGESPIFISNTKENLTQEATEKCHVKVVPRGTVLVSFKLTVGRVSIAAQPLATNEAIAHFLIPTDFVREYTYLYLKKFPYSTLGSTSSISTAINSKIVKDIPFIMPEEKILLEFHHRLEPIFREIESIEKRIELLQEARDRLLPRLMSGEIDVEKMARM